MARKGDLAGIAALAALGMSMANRGNRGSVTERQIAADREANAEPQGAGSDSDMYSDYGPSTGRGAAGTSETMSSSARPSVGGTRPASGARPTTRSTVDAVPRLIDRTPPQGGSGGGRGPTAEELAAYRNQSSSRYPDVRGSAADSLAAENRRKIREGSEGIEPVYPEQMIGGPGLKTAQSIAKSLAARTAGREAPAAASPFLKELPAPTKQLTGPSKADLMARDRAARASGRNEEMLRENARRYGLDPDNMNPAAAQAIRKGLGGDEFSLPLKKGGKVKGYAMGGTIKSSASSRGDGIATKGKTRGRMC